MKLVKKIAQIALVASTMVVVALGQDASEASLSLTTRIDLSSLRPLNGMTIRDLVVTAGRMYFVAYPHPAQLVNGVLLSTSPLRF